MNIIVTYRTKCPTLIGLNKEEEIIRDYLDGLPMLQLEHKYNVHRAALKRILTRNGVELKTRKEIRNSDHYALNFKKRKYKVCVPEIQKDIVEMYLKQNSPEIIAKKYHVTPKVIRHHLKKSGIKMRTAAESAQQNITKLRKMRKPTFAFRDFEHNGVIYNNIQGWEHFGIKYTAQNLCTSNEEIIAGRVDAIPLINYNFNSKKRTYFPDIYIPHLNFLIEVKSTYTFRAHKELNLAKQQAAKNAGYKHQIIIFNHRGDVLQII
jgi:hypothetical protein